MLQPTSTEKENTHSVEGMHVPTCLPTSNNPNLNPSPTVCTVCNTHQPPTQKREQNNNFCCYISSETLQTFFCIPLMHSAIVDAIVQHWGAGQWMRRCYISKLKCCYSLRSLKQLAWLQRCRWWACRKRKAKCKLNSEIKPALWQKTTICWMDWRNYESTEVAIAEGMDVITKIHFTKFRHLLESRIFYYKFI